MSGMFLNCNSLISLPKIEKWNIDNLKDYKIMFENCNPDLQIPRMFVQNRNNFMNNQIRSDLFNRLTAMEGGINDENIIGNLNFNNNQNPFPFNNEIFLRNINQYPEMIPNIINNDYLGDDISLYDDIY
jgi:hypothetical protein